MTRLPGIVSPPILLSNSFGLFGTAMLRVELVLKLLPVPLVRYNQQEQPRFKKMDGKRVVDQRLFILQSNGPFLSLINAAKNILKSILRPKRDRTLID